MSIQVNDKNLGHATAYAYAVAGGYTGTEAEFTELLGNIADDLEQIENLTVTVETLAAGSSATASYSNGVLHLGIPKGDKGDGAYHIELSGESFVIHTDASGVAAAQEFMIYIDARQGTTKKVISRVEGLPSISTGSGTIAPEIIKHAFTGSVATIIYTIPANTQISAGQINAQYTAYINDGTANGFGVRCALSVAVVKDGAKGDTGATGSTGPTGNGIASVAKTGTSGLVDTYTITYTNGNTSAFTVTNGAEAVDDTLTIAGRAADAKKTGDEISELKEDLTAKVDVTDLLKAFPTDSAQGAIASFSDGAELPLKSLTVDIEPVQDLHGQDAPYPAGGGINVWDEEWEEGSLGNRGENILYPNVRSKNYIPILPNNTYYIKASTGLVLFWYDANKTFISKSDGGINNQTVTPPTNAAYLRFRTVDSYGATYKNDISINYPSTDTEYHPYSNICPISGHTQAVVTRTGVNVWDEEWEVGGISTNTGANESASDIIRSKNYIDVLPNTAYYCTYANGTAVYNCFFYDSDKNFISYVVTNNGLVATPSNCAFMRFRCKTSYGTTYNHDICINYPATDTEYHPYSGTSITIPLGQTVYGGKLDVVSGVLTIDNGYKNKDNVRKEIYTINGHPVWLMEYDTASIGSTEVSAISSVLKQGDYNGIYAGQSNIVAQNSQGRLIANVDGISSVSDIDTWLNANPDFLVVYKLATPLTIQLDPHEVTALLGSNNIWADTGDSTVEYRADPTLYIQRKIAEALS